MTLRILIAPAGFKESLSSYEVADYIAAGVRQALPDAQIHKAPLVDGGEGFTKALVTATGGTLHKVSVTGPLGQRVQAHYGLLGGTDSDTAILEMASAAGLRLIPHDQRDPSRTTTYGVGELISAALDTGAEKLLIGCGDSGTNDGGAGMAQALGVDLLDSMGKSLGWGGGELHKLAYIDLDGCDPRLEHKQIDVACNSHNLLCGPKGVTRIYGTQKGASPEVITNLEEGLENLASIIKRDLDIDVRTIPGGGASGGLGVGLYAFFGAKLHHYLEIVFRYMEFVEILPEVDLVITAEGSIDYKTPLGKIPFEVARCAKDYQLPVVALAGSIGKDAHVNRDHGIDAMMNILEEPATLSKVMENAAVLLTTGAERLTRMILLGRSLNT